MEKLEHLTSDSLWTDFSISSPLEEAMALVENILRNWTKGSQSILKETFQYQGSSYNMKLFPQNHDKIDRINDTLNFNTDVVKSIREMFNINTQFVIVYSSGQIFESQLILLKTIINQALNASGFKDPIFIKEQYGDNTRFNGVQFKNNKAYYYSSRSEQYNPKELSSFKMILQTMQSLYKVKPSAVTINQRSHLSITESDNKSQTKYITDTFYAAHTIDPVKILHVVLYWEPQKIEIAKFSNAKPDHIVLQINSIKSIGDSSNLRNFLDLLIKKDSNYFVNDPSLIESYVESIFRTPYKTEDPKCFIPSAPHYSALSRFAIYATSFSFREEFEVAWKAFKRHIKKCINTKQRIRGIEDSGVMQKYCLLYQKLQMVNFCIAHPGAAFLSPDDTNKKLLAGPPMVCPARLDVPTRTEDQVENLEAITRLQMFSDAAAFKAENPLAVFEDFVRWYAPSNFDEDRRAIRGGAEKLREIWEGAFPRKALDQEPLFDPAAEAQLAMDYIDGLTTDEVISQLVPIAISEALNDLRAKASPRISRGPLSTVEEAIRRLSGVSAAPTQLFVDTVDDTLDVIEAASIQIETAASLFLKIGNAPQTISGLLLGRPVAVPLQELPEVQRGLLAIGVESNEEMLIRSRDYRVVCDCGVVLQDLFLSDQIDYLVIASKSSELI